MFERFIGTFGPPTPQEPTSDIAQGVLSALFYRFGGCTFASGLYRVHSAASSTAASRLVVEAYPEYRGAIKCFGFDWLGNQFAINLRDPSVVDPGVLLFDPATGYVLDMPVPYSAFHDVELVEDHEAALGSSFFEKWLLASGPTPNYDQCVGYRRPLFLGGEDDTGNLELSDIEVYWTLSGQILRQVRGLPPGTPVNIAPPTL